MGPVAHSDRCVLRDLRLITFMANVMYLTRGCDTRCHLFNKHFCFVPATVLSALKILNPNNANEIEILLLPSLYRREN